MALVLPKISKKNSLKPKKLLWNDWEGSDDEGYIKANERVALHKGYSAASYLIKKYINKVKYCFDKLGVLSAENYTNEVNLNDRDLDYLKGNTLSNGYSYLEFDEITDSFSIIVSRLNDNPFWPSNKNKSERKLFKRRESSEKLSKTNGDIHIQVDQIGSIVQLSKLNPSDVYGSLVRNEEKLRNFDPEETPAAKEMINHQRVCSNNDDEDGSFNLKSEQSEENKEIDAKLFYNTGVYEFTHPLKEIGLKEEGWSEDWYTNLFLLKSEIK